MGPDNKKMHIVSLKSVFILSDLCSKNILYYQFKY